MLQSSPIKINANHRLPTNNGGDIADALVVCVNLYHTFPNFLQTRSKHAYLMEYCASLKLWDDFTKLIDKKIHPIAHNTPQEMNEIHSHHTIPKEHCAAFTWRDFIITILETIENNNISVYLLQLLIPIMEGYP